MRLGRTATQWATILVLLVILGLINHYRPDLTGFDIGKTEGSSGGGYVAVDGDSFRAGKTEVRLHGIDAPEYRQTCSDARGESKSCGRMARDALSKLIRGRTISCTIIDEDRYGRQVSVCRDGTLEINREMVRLGWALAYRKHSTAYVSAEREAKAARRGIWQWNFDAPQSYRERQRAVEGNMAASED